MRSSRESSIRIPADQRERTLLREAAVLLAADLTSLELFEALCELLAQFIDASVVFVALHNGTELRIVHVHDHGVIRRETDISIEPESQSWKTMETGAPMLYRNPGDWSGVRRFPLNEDRPWTDDTVAAVFVPLEAAGHRLGVLSVQSTTPNAYDERDVVLVETLARYLAIAVRNQQLFERVRRSSEIEPVTGLSSHSRVLSAIDDNLRDLDNDGVLAIVTLDVTNFGMINDTHGTATGDAVLALVADRLRRLHDERTIAGRLAGDDFILVGRRRDRAEAEALVRAALESTRGIAVPIGHTTVPVSINCGYVVAPDEGRARSPLMALADLRLRLSVQTGQVIGGTVAAIRRFGDYRGVEPIVDAALNRDPYTRVHLLHVNHLAHTWAPQLGLDLDEWETFVRASLLHDIGKLLIADSILLKPATLTHAEFDVMRRHADFGRQILTGEPEYERIARIVGQHHEWYDGRGYPDGLRGDAIDPLARAVAIVDAYSAMTVDRPYHPGIEPAAALAELERCAGTQFDPDLTRSFVRMQQAAG